MCTSAPAVLQFISPSFIGSRNKYAEARGMDTVAGIHHSVTEQENYSDFPLHPGISVMCPETKTGWLSIHLLGQNSKL